MTDLTADEYLDVACAYLRGLNSPCRTPEEGERAAAKLEEIREALWAVRVLDAWTRRRPISLAGNHHKALAPQCTLNADGSRVFYIDKAPGAFATEDAARIAAAKALVAEDPTLEPQELP